ncbi:MAG TPA: NAD(P)-dependent oxidoreductase [Labilithrix sp.]|nr:NAD(P)-dependent oxidoreductase [Labilithrix sp.]
MKILVTGCSGFLGVPTVERLLAHGERDLRCFLRPGSKRDRLEAVLRRYPDAKVERFVGSLGSPQSAAEAVEGCDVVYHLAAALSGAPADMFLNTVVTTRHLLDAVRAQKKPPKIVHCSSFGVYGVAQLPRGAMVDESTPFEPHPERRDPYSQAKLRQEALVWEYARQYAIPTVVLRPGVIYGPGGGAFSTRVGLNLFGLFLHLGGKNLLPITYVDNCAEAIAVAGRSPAAEGQAFNVVDDDLVTASRWLELYRKRVKRIPTVRIPYAGLTVMSELVARYHKYSKGQLPAVFTRYKSATTWGGNRFDNTKLKSLGWRPIVSTEDGLSRAFEDLKARTALAS